MDASRSPAPEPAPRPSQSIRDLAGTLICYVEARLRLLQIEGKEAGGQIILVLILAAFACGALAGTWLLAAPAAVMLISQKTGWPWTQVALGAAGAHLIAAWLLLVMLKSRIARLQLFEESRNQLIKDREWLAPKQP